MHLLNKLIFVFIYNFCLLSKISSERKGRFVNVLRLCVYEHNPVAPMNVNG